MQRLSIHLSDPATRRAIPLPWHRATEAVMSTDPNGCQQLRVTLPMRHTAALPLVANGMGLAMAVYAGGRALWAGRLEEPGITISADGTALTLTAYGAQMAFDDIPYTALWSKSDYDGWQVIRTVDVSSFTEKRFTYDTSDRLFISPKKGLTPGIGGLSAATPAGGSRTLTTFTADYAVYLPTGWSAGLVGQSRTFTSRSTLWTLAGNAGPTLQTGSLSVSVGSKDRIEFDMFTTGSPGAPTVDDGTYYARLINVRMQTISATVTANAIAADMLGAVIAANSTQLSADTTRILAQGVDLKDESYLDANMRSVLDRLVGYGDSSGNRWAWRVWADGVLRLEPITTGAKTYRARLSSYDASRVMKDSYSQVYATYADSAGTRQVTSTRSISPAPRIARRLALAAQGKDSATATQERDAAFADMADPVPAVRMQITHLYDTNGTPVPLWRLRSGDVVDVADLAPNLSTRVDRYTRFRVLSTQYTLTTNELGVDLETPNKQLAYLLARREEGL